MLKRKSVSKYKVLTQQTECVCVCVCVCACNTGQKGRIAILERRLVSNLRPEGGLGTVTFNYSTVSDPVALDFTASSTSKLSTKSTTTVLSTGNAKALLVECWVPFTFATGGLEPYLQTRNLGFLYTDTKGYTCEQKTYTIIGKKIHLLCLKAWFYRTLPPPPLFL